MVRAMCQNTGWLALKIKVAAVGGREERWRKKKSDEKRKALLFPGLHQTKYSRTLTECGTKKGVFLLCSPSPVALPLFLSFPVPRGKERIAEVPAKEESNSPPPFCPRTCFAPYS